jgi:hypothetical protein
MPSAALIRWQSDRMPRLALTDAHCAGLLAALAASPTVRSASAAAVVPTLAEESLQGYVLLLSGHFQGFCRDLYTECSQLFAATLPLAMQATIQAQFAAGLALTVGNPTIGNVRKDFERFGFILDLTAGVRGNVQRITQLGHLNFWRNHVAHQKATSPPTGVPAVLTLPDVQKWRTACDELAISLDDIMKQELTRILGSVPW